jgi:hypothetical protein
MASEAGFHIFNGWSNAGCTGTGTCAVTMTRTASVTGTFVPWWQGGRQKKH